MKRKILGWEDERILKMEYKRGEGEKIFEYI